MDKKYRNHITISVRDSQENRDNIEKIKIIAVLRKLRISEVISEAFSDYIMKNRQVVEKLI